MDSVGAKAFILHSCTNLRKADPASHYHKIYATPDLTPAQREANLQLRTKLKEMNKDSKSYIIKNGEDSAKEELDFSSCTDNTVNYTHSNYPQSTVAQTFPNQADSTLPVIINSTLRTQVF